MKKDLRELSVSLAAVVIWFVASNPAYSQNVFRLYTTIQEQQCQLFVNGFPLREADPTNNINASTLLDSFLLKGTNILVLKTLENPGATNEPTVILRLDYGEGRPDQRTNFFILTREALIGPASVTENISFDAGKKFHFELRNYLE